MKMSDFDKLYPELKDDLVAVIVSQITLDLLLTNVSGYKVTPGGSMIFHSSICQ